MPFDVIGWSEAAPGTGTPGIAAGLLDQLYTVQGDGIKIQSKAPWLLGLLYGAESTPGYAQLNSPTIKYPYEFVKAVDADGITAPQNGFTDHRDRPLPLIPGEYHTAYSNNATDEDTIIAAFVGDKRIGASDLDAVQYITHKLRGYADQTITANTWTLVTPTWDYVLPTGRYAIVGMKFGTYKAANPGSGVARCILPDTQWRPGVPMAITTGDKLQCLSMAELPFSKWPYMPDVSFPYDNTPKFEVLTPYANTDHIVELDLIKVQ